MAPYVDEHGPDMVRLGLQWHPKMLLRIEIAGTLINAYDTYSEWFKTEGIFPVDYFVGGLVTGGIAFQPSGALSGPSSGEQFDELIGRWMAKQVSHCTLHIAHCTVHPRVTICTPKSTYLRVLHECGEGEKERERERERERILMR